MDNARSRMQSQPVQRFAGPEPYWTGDVTGALENLRKEVAYLLEEIRSLVAQVYSLQQDLVYDDETEGESVGEVPSQDEDSGVDN